ncbi:holin-like protein [Paenibacillus phyllosphaerae]|uniref:Holin-like protein n=1 Tax=Paenibacillus phyllosphaerae TaxID=274593 RepID=A0A7W5B3U7_9BACL|nr:CidA/LrgA family protein [Paenibacillus phyllosphaerae]MBB3113914.1 holin-like protein [Paenibacillus phyllosphaerae]
MRGFAILAAFWLLGELITFALGAPLPGQVVGMVLLLAALLQGWIKEAWIKEAAELLLSRLMLFFAPIIVGVMVYAPMLKQNWLPVTGAVVPGSLLVLAATGYAIQLMEARKRRVQKGEHHVGA